MHGGFGWEYGCWRGSCRIQWLGMAKGNGKLLVQFVKPDVVRVRFQPEGKFAGNGTDVCVPRKDKKIKLRYGKDYLSMTSDSLVVKIDQSTGAISYFDHQHHLLWLKT